MANPGSVLFSFENKGVIKIPTKYNEDDVIEASLNNGIDDIDFIEQIEGDEEEENLSTDPLNKLITT
eukprot:CAMPEP_0196766964 /NCGR_PEP_ID=MMETSP1095-20130614/33585_1 /TAXON_ID=96789 ORGANISM="Chromulina nebulosa, Strain UTEXLB2642" /NCGR_SAMPLE_ID=MMETSP1095 /ASSEMBLY_ACC=CAM_ASM_000446 /LENGTH=66 /DNA_ID=CAMNT_0042132261 /DNA_START=46 /DNA_END=242 /DNA_ORIENTATION=-